MRLAKSASLVVRFWANVVKTDSCWRWTAARTEDGYGRIFGNGRSLRAHRLSFEIHLGPIPDGMQVLHRCDNPQCCNPEHLFLGTTADNMADKFAKGRENLPSRSGENHWMRRSPERVARGTAFRRSHLTEATVAEIRAKYSTGHFTQRALAAEYGIDHRNLHLIINRKTWKHVA